MKKVIIALLIVGASLGLAFYVYSMQLEEEAGEESSLSFESSDSTTPPPALPPPPPATEPPPPPPEEPPPPPAIVRPTPPPPAPKVKTPPPPPAAVKPRVISVESGDLFYKPSVIRLKQNETVKLVIKNNGEHTFTVTGLGINVPLNGPSGSVTVTPKKKGTFPIFCAIAGHKEAGMVGTIIVE